MKKKGKITPNGVVLETHENATVVFLTEQGYDIELIPPSNTPKSKTPDFIMNGKAWEMKSPQGKSKASIERIFKKAVKQSINIIIDLARTKVDEESALKEITRRFSQSGTCKHIIIITKNRKLLEFKR